MALFVLVAGRCVLDCCWDERVVGGESRAKKELKVEELLLRCDRGLSFEPSLLKDVLSDDISASAALKEALDFRRNERSFMNEGILTVVKSCCRLVLLECWLNAVRTVQMRCLRAWKRLKGVVRAACMW